jgi:putative ABC transport system substrate-binding protein
VKRRDFVLGAGAAMASAYCAKAQQRPPIFGILLAFSTDAGQVFTKPIRAYMQALGFVDGQNVEFDVRYAAGRVERLPGLAAELVTRRPTVIATFGDATGLAAKAATSEIPIVAMSEDLVRAKLVTRMARPEGNITGLSVMGTELDAKRLDLIAEVLPRRASILLLADATTHRESRPSIDASAATLGVAISEAIVRSPDEIDRAMRDAKQSGIAGVNVLSSAFLFAVRERIVDHAARHGLATIFQWPETAEEGGLMAYGPSLLGAFRHVCTLAAKILRGAKPADLPVEQPTKFEYRINLRTAKTLGLTIPEAVLVRADKAIE